MKPKKLFFEKEVVARLQDEEMSHIVGASSHGNTSSTKDETPPLEPVSNPDDGDADPSKSCCQKSCNDGK